MTLHTRHSRAGAAFRALAALVALTTLLAGLPAMLVAVGADPRTARLPTWHHLRQLLLTRDDGTVLLTVLRVTAWACWAVFALTVLAETAAAVTGWTTVRLRTLAPIQHPAALLIAAITAAVSTSTPAAAATPAAHAATAPADPEPQVVPGRSGAASPNADSTGEPSAAAGHAAADRRLATAAPTVTVGRYDSLWRIAERRLGDGHRWAEIYRLNVGRRQPDGRTLTDPDHLEEGWVLVLPADRPAPEDAGSTRSVVVVQRGDTLAQLAELQLGQAGAWPAIFAANERRIQPDGGRLTNPDLIRPGWRLAIPPQVAVYEVAPGDHLEAIAERFLGQPERYREIAALNRYRIPGNSGPHGPDHIRPGWRLILPSDAHDAGARRHADGQLRSKPPAAPTPSRGRSPGAHQHGRSKPNPAPPTPTHPPPGTPPTPAPSRSPSPPRPSTGTQPTNPTSPPADPAHRDRPPGVDLPGGWVTAPLAAAIVVAAGLVWLRRRRRYAPGPTATPVHDDPDLRPLPPAVAVLRRGVREQAPQLLDQAAEPADQRTVADVATDAAPPPAPPIGSSGPDLAGLGHLPPDGLGLTGPGADAAARGLIIATLSTGGPADPDARGQILIPSTTFIRLLDGHTDPANRYPRLRVVHDVTEALTVLDELLVERHRLLDEYDAGDLAELHAAEPYHPPMPPVLVIADAADVDEPARLSSTLQLGAAVAVAGVLLGDWTAGTTITVHADGHVDDPTRDDQEDRPRLATLDVRSTRDLLDVLIEAHTTGPTPAEPARRPADADDDDEPTKAPTRAPANETSPQPAAKRPHSAGQKDELAPARHARAGAPARVRLFGAPAILGQSGDPVTGLRHHATGLLVYLTVHPGGADLPDIMEAFWPTALVRRASERLSTEVGNLRRRLRQALGDSKAQPVLNTGGHYQLDPGLLDIDVWNLTDALAAAAHVDDPATRIGTLRRAVAAHAGALADGLDYGWLEQHREQYRRHGIRARLQLAELVDDPAEAAALTRAAVELDPYNEDLARQAIRAAARIRDTRAIAAILSRLTAALDEIDEEPSAETMALGRQLGAAAGTPEQGTRIT